MSYPKGVGVFLSAVSSEFGQVRSDIAEDLRARGLEVKVQEEFTQAGLSTTLDRLDAYIQNCAEVICVVGERSGSIPPVAASEKYQQDDLPQNVEQPSYTQWEMILARRYDKNPRIYYSRPPYEAEQEEETGTNDPELQQQFVDWLFEEIGLNRAEFGDRKDLRILVLREDWLPPKVNGVRHEAVPSPAGYRAEEAPGPEMKRRKVVLTDALPVDESSFIGRSMQKAQLKARILRGREPIVAVVGPVGAGKKTLLSRVASELGLGSTVDDGALIEAEMEDQRSHEDLLQSIADQLYETDHPGTVLVMKRNRLLQQERVRVFVPDADSSADMIQQLRTAMPNARFFLTAAEWEATDAFRMPLGGFTDSDEMVELFQDRYLAEVPLSARDDIAVLCGALDGLPSLITLLADKAFNEAFAEDAADPHPLEAWAIELRGKTPSELRSALLPPSEARNVGEIAAAVGVSVPEQVLVAVTSAEALASAQSGGAVKAASPRYSVNTALDIVAADASVMDDVLDHAVEWAERASGPEIYANRAFLVRMMHWALDHQRWNDVVRLGEATETPMALGGRHGAWEEILKCTAVAASQLDPPDEDAEARALHQLGSRALLRDELADARVLLHEAFRKRSRDDVDGRAISRNNLRLVPAAIITLMALLLWSLLLIGVGVAVNLDPYPLNFGDVPAPSTEPVPKSTGALRTTAPEATEFRVRIKGDSDVFCVTDGVSCVADSPTSVGSGRAADGSCKLAVDARGQVTVMIPSVGSCFLWIGFAPQLPGDYSADLVLVSEGYSEEFPPGILRGRGTLPVAEVSPDVGEFSSSGDTRDFTVTNVGNEPFVIGPITPPTDFKLGNEDCTEKTSLDEGEGCTFTIIMEAGAAVSVLELDLRPLDRPQGRVAGDSRILLVIDS